MKEFLVLVTTFILTGAAGLLSGQTPTHIDQGTTDDSVHILDEPGYLYMVIALIFILVAWLFLMRRRNRNRRRRDRD